MSAHYLTYQTLRQKVKKISSWPSVGREREKEQNNNFFRKKGGYDRRMKRVRKRKRENGDK